MTKRGFHRVVEGLKWAERRLEGPWGTRGSRPRGAKALGVTYEKALAKALPDALRGVWWEFEDANGGGWCQTDLLLEGRETTLVLEAKLSWVMQGHSQLELLYKPVLELALGKPVLGVVVCKTLRSGMPASVSITSDLPSALALARSARRPVLHWIGNGPLLTRPASVGLLALPHMRSITPNGGLSCH